MIRYIRGKLIGKSERGIVVLVGDAKSGETDPKNMQGVGYEIEVPGSTQRALSGQGEGEDVELFISFQQSQQQPVPRLYGFKHQLERDFFEELLRVEDVGPRVALTAMSSVSVPHIAKAIVDRDVKSLKSLKGVGEKTAEKMIAELRSRAAKYALLPEGAVSALEEPIDFKTEVRETLVKQLGFKPVEAQRAIEDAMKRNPKIASPEDLFDEVLRGHK